MRNASLLLIALLIWSSPTMARPNSSSAIGAYVDGLREAKARFAALPPFMQQKRIDVNSATAAAVVFGAQQRLIASPSIQTRTLLNHVKWKISKTNGSAVAGVTSGSTVITFAHMGGITRKIRVKGVLVTNKRGLTIDQFGATQVRALSATQSNATRLVRPSRYAHLIEFGTAQFAAEPFMMPATAAQKEPHLQRWRAAGRELEHEMTSGGGLL